MNIDNLIGNIEDEAGIRQKLIELRVMQNNNDTREAVNRYICCHWQKLIRLFDHNDAKVRKNAALLLGDAHVQEAADALCDAYVEENTLFVRPAFLKALGQLDYRAYIKNLKDRMEEIQVMEIEPSNRKHLDEERHLLSELLDMARGSGRHIYSGKIMSKVILTTKKGLEDILCTEFSEQFPGNGMKKMNGGVMVQIKDPFLFMRLRTWQTMLFVFCDDNGFEKDSDKIAEGIINSHILEYLSQRHTGKGAWRFRIDLRTKDAASQKAVLAKKTAFALEEKGKGHLLNSVSDYEIEFLIMEGNNEQLYVYLKLHTLPDDRFSYRENFTSASMNPVTAAQMIALCRPYFSDNANILDPFCGTGALLIERKLCIRSRQNMNIRSLYGVDIYGAAIAGGRENAQKSHCHVNFIQRDFFDFTHSYTFDEVITDPPVNFISDADEVIFWEKFYKKICGHLSQNAKIFIFAKHLQLIKKALTSVNNLEIIMERPFSLKNHTWILILKHSKEITNN